MKRDMIAQDANCHRNCLTDLKKANAAQLNGSYEEEEYQHHELVFSEIVARKCALFNI